MACPKLTMEKKDVQCAISHYVSTNYPDISIQGREHPESLSRVLATIQGNEYHGAGKYNVLLDIYGSVKEGSIGIKENVHFTSMCSVIVEQDSNNSPKISIRGNIYLTKQIF